MRRLIAHRAPLENDEIIEVGDFVCVRASAHRVRLGSRAVLLVIRVRKITYDLDESTFLFHSDEDVDGTDLLYDIEAGTLERTLVLRRAGHRTWPRNLVVSKLDASLDPHNVPVTKVGTHQVVNICSTDGSEISPAIQRMARVYHKYFFDTQAPDATDENIL